MHEKACSLMKNRYKILNSSVFFVWIYILYEAYNHLKMAKRYATNRAHIEACVGRIENEKGKLHGTIH
jgi:hypothetical protein